ncbi:hypothetical protein BDP55DRAFT_267291 [Colletotrichum godetiae]|uniref:Uncharacterized protein n=1 Tax=Colletotrichum godetiae TaxID=1209918 RepID=A0AAJ0AWA5_9PEZI|nr:uncharacterized protein BDP55DRAFT_267291 [Colletotrichum godetiae]KAK1691529.1 hypothetical protein BDP55DRAFT_267291 [Colletotrichum godetiae]
MRLIVGTNGPYLGTLLCGLYGSLSLISGDVGAIFFSLYGVHSNRSISLIGIRTQVSPRRVPRPRNDALLSISLVKRRGPLAFRPSPGFCHRSNHNCSLGSPGLSTWSTEPEVYYGNSRIPRPRYPDSESSTTRQRVLSSSNSTW